MPHFFGKPAGKLATQAICIAVAIVASSISTTGLADSSISSPDSPGDRLLQEEIQQAIGKHPSVLATIAQLNSANFKLSADEWARFPALQGSVSRADNGDTVQVWELRQPLWAGGRIDGTIDGSKWRAVAAAHRQKEAEQDLAEQIIVGAVELSRTSALIKTSQENLEALERLLTSIDRRSEGGLGLQSDVTLARARIESARAALSQLDYAKEQALSRWQFLTGKSSFSLRLPLPPPAFPITTHDAVAAAIRVSPTLGRLRAESAAASSDADVVRAQALPELSIRYRNSRQRGALNQSGNETLAVLEFQPDAGFGVADSARAAEALRDGIIHQIAQSERDIEQKIRAITSELHGLIAQLAAVDRNISANKEIIESFIRQYNIGKRTWLDVLNAQREINESLLQRDEIHHRQLAANYRLRLLTGSFLNKQ